MVRMKYFFHELDFSDIELYYKAYQSGENAACLFLKLCVDKLILFSKNKMKNSIFFYLLNQNIKIFCRHVVNSLASLTVRLVGLLLQEVGLQPHPFLQFIHSFIYFFSGYLFAFLLVGGHLPFVMSASGTPGCLISFSSCCECAVCSVMLVTLPIPH